MSFSELGICPEILEAIEVLGFETPSPIQARAIPPALSGADILGLSHTGSGKTLAFSIPALECIDPGLRSVQVLCLAPTRELAVQICREVDKLALFLDGVSAAPIYGGASFGPQLAALKRGVQFVVGTPGRVIDLMEQGELRVDNISMLILDEADEMLDMGFQEDIERVVAMLPGERQTLLFSATMSPAIRKLVDSVAQNPQEIEIERPQLTVPTCEQCVYEVVFSSRIEVLSRLIEMGRMKRGLVFANTKRVVDDIVDGLLARGYAVDRLHGDMPQTLRERVMDSFRKGNLTVLVATDIAARGLDIDDVDTVVNFELPRDPEDYVHRIGRTARAGRKGRAVSFIGRRDFSLLGRLERFVGVRMQREKVMTGTQVEEVRRESLVDEILEKAATSSDLPEALRDIDMPAEQLLAAMFNLLVSKTSRELQPIPEDRPSKFARSSRGADEDGASVEKGNDWSSLQQSVTLFMNGGKLLGLRPKDIAGLFYNEGGAPKGTVGDIRLFLKHSLIEVSPEIAPQLIERLGTCHICGYEVNIREDKGRPAQSNAPYEREFRPHDRERRGASYAGRGNGNFRRDSRERQDRSERVFYDKFSRRSRRRG
ncbi:MAG: DEAD/DEAH box helicase [Akkermansia sp.]|nr:DEAD/DEAH box helicase [Akkermansia sp.]MBR2314648.1 DEAD/DEAH box helicase [Akkermansia sp.]